MRVGSIEFTAEGEVFTTAGANNCQAAHAQVDILAKRGSATFKCLVQMLMRRGFTAPLLGKIATMGVAHLLPMLARSEDPRVEFEVWEVPNPQVRVQGQGAGGYGQFL